jgi:flagellin-like protein
MKMNKKAVSPVIAVMLLVAVAVAAVGAYFIWYKSFQQSSQSDVEEKTGTIGSKLSITNVTNDNSNFYITVKNATGKDLVPNATDPDSEATVAMTIKDENGNDFTKDLQIGGAGNGSFTSGSVPDGDEGQLEITGPDITAGETYTIIITAGGTTSTQKYTAI